MIKLNKTSISRSFILTILVFSFVINFSTFLAVQLMADTLPLVCKRITFSVNGGNSIGAGSTHSFIYPPVRPDTVSVDMVIEAVPPLNMAAGDVVYTQGYNLAYKDRDVWDVNNPWLYNRNITFTQNGSSYFATISLQLNTANRSWLFKMEENTSELSSRTMVDADGNGSIDCDAGRGNEIGAELTFNTVLSSNISSNFSYSGLCTNLARDTGINTSEILDKLFTCQTAGTADRSQMNLNAAFQSGCFTPNQAASELFCEQKLAIDSNLTLCLPCQTGTVNNDDLRRQALTHGDLCTATNDEGQPCANGRLSCRRSLLNTNEIRCLAGQNSIVSGIQGANNLCTPGENECGVSITNNNADVLTCTGSSGLGNHCAVTACTQNTGAPLISLDSDCGNQSFCVGRAGSAGTCVSSDRLVSILSSSSKDAYLRALNAEFGAQDVSAAFNAIGGSIQQLTAAGVSPNVIDWFVANAGPTAQRALTLVTDVGGGIGDGIGDGLNSVSDLFGARNCSDKPGSVPAESLRNFETARANSSNPDSVYLIDYIDCSNGANAAYCSCAKCVREGAVWTALGCIVTTPAGIFTRLVQISLGLMGGVALGRGIYFGIIYYYGDDKEVGKAREGMISTIGGIFVVILSVVILRIIGVNVLDIVPAGFFGGQPV